MLETDYFLFDRGENKKKRPLLGDSPLQPSHIREIQGQCNTTLHQAMTMMY